MSESFDVVGPPDPHKKRCIFCWNFVDYCRCPIPSDVCRVHHMPNDRKPQTEAACLCNLQIGPQFQCENCDRYNVVLKSKGLGYICDECLSGQDESPYVGKIARYLEGRFGP